VNRALSKRETAPAKRRQALCNLLGRGPSTVTGLARYFSDVTRDTIARDLHQLRVDGVVVARWGPSAARWELTGEAQTSRSRVDVRREAITELLAGGSQSLHDVMWHMNLSRAAATYALHRLKRKGLVHWTRENPQTRDRRRWRARWHLTEG